MLFKLIASHEGQIVVSIDHNFYETPKQVSNY